jgi:hypothetical protein
VEDEVDEEPPEEDGGEGVSDSQPRELSSLELELQNAPRRRQRFILQKALKIRNIETEGRPRKQVRYYREGIGNAYLRQCPRFSHMNADMLMDGLLIMQCRALQ